MIRKPDVWYHDSGHAVLNEEHSRMPRRARRSYPTNYATDLTDEQWAAIRAARRHPVAQRRAPDQDRSPGDRQRAAL